MLTYFTPELLHGSMAINPQPLQPKGPKAKILGLSLKSESPDSDGRVSPTPKPFTQIEGSAVGGGLR